MVVLPCKRLLEHRSVLSEGRSVPFVDLSDAQQFVIFLFVADTAFVLSPWTVHLPSVDAFSTQGIRHW
jgi:hypothetical protein